MSQRRTKLNKTDKEILNLILEGKTSKEIGEIICLSSRTVEDRRSKLYNYFGVQNKTELVVQVIRHRSIGNKP